MLSRIRIWHPLLYNLKSSHPLSSVHLPSSYLRTIRPDYVNTHCASCHVLQSQRLFHTSPNLSAGKLKNTKRKIIKKVVFNKKKSIKSTWETVAIRPNMTVAEIAEILQKDVDHVFEALFYIPSTDSYDSAQSVIDDFNVIKQVIDKSGFRWKLEEKKKIEIKENKDAFKRPPPDPSVLKHRPPVVTIMGHVDHGKTTLLDALRNTNVVAQEFGGITQHIGAFSVTLPSGDTITFLDTPGHAAFSSMRARGAQVTDIVVLVVAADDGVMRQTTESIRHAREANVPLIIAINKIDRHEANIERTKHTLSQQGVYLEEQGGDVPAVEVSALKGTNLDQLQETIITLSELLEIQADYSGPVEGAIVEAKVDPGKGKVSTVLVQRGTLSKGCCIVAGKAWAKVRSLYSDKGHSMKEAPPGVAVEVSGWKDLPAAGDIVIQVDSELRAREVVSWREEQERMRKAEQDRDEIRRKQDEHKREYSQLRQERLDSGRRSGAIYGKMKTKEAIESYTGSEFSIILKGDVDGSIEALLNVLETYTSDQCRLNLLQFGVGAVSEQDVEMAASFNGHIYAFNVETPAKILQQSQNHNVPIHNHNVIYHLVEDLKEQLNQRVPETPVETNIGEANVQQHFTVTENKKKTHVAGCRCVKGLLQKNKQFRLVRNGQVILEGPLSSLRHFKEEVGVIKENQECGLMFQNTDVEPQAGDMIICYDTAIVKKDIIWDLDF